MYPAPRQLNARGSALRGIIVEPARGGVTAPGRRRDAVKAGEVWCRREPCDRYRRDYPRLGGV